MRLLRPLSGDDSSKSTSVVFEFCHVKTRIADRAGGNEGRKRAGGEDTVPIKMTDGLGYEIIPRPMAGSCRPKAPTYALSANGDVTRLSTLKCSSRFRSTPVRNAEQSVWCEGRLICHINFQHIYLWHLL